MKQEVTEPMLRIRQRQTKTISDGRRPYIESKKNKNLKNSKLGFTGPIRRVDISFK